MRFLSSIITASLLSAVSLTFAGYSLFNEGEATAVSVNAPDITSMSSVSVVHQMTSTTIVTTSKLAETTIIETTTKPTNTSCSTVTLITTEQTEAATKAIESISSAERTGTTESSDIEDVSDTNELDWSYESDDSYVYFPNKENPRFTLTWKDYYLLCNCVAHEYGADFVPEYDKALVAEVVMNRVQNAYGGISKENPNAIYSVITARGQFSGSSGYANLNGFSRQVTQSTQDAVCMFLCHYGDEGVFDEGYTGFWGDGTWNHFR